MEIEKKTGPKDVFLHLSAILALYFSAGSLIALVFQYINLAFPDPLEGSLALTEASARAVIRWSISVLIVVFPAYLLITRYLNKSYLLFPERLELRTRKWVLYFTLFAAAAVIIGDLVALVFHLLGGELTVRFVLKIIAILLIAGAIFFYYYWELKTKKT
jgi:uncharacterized protein YacL